MTRNDKDTDDLLSLLRRTAYEQEQMIVDFQHELDLLNNLIDKIEKKKH